MGLVGSWKRFVETDEGKLLLTCLKEGRNDKTSVKLFLKLRKTLLKNLNQKVLQEIALTHCICQPTQKTQSQWCTPLV
jgi:hypothetical protein